MKLSYSSSPFHIYITNHLAPRRERTAGTVVNRILISPQKDRCRTYCKSIRTHSLKVTCDLPWTCQIQVKPGVTSSRRRCQSRHEAVSLQGKGRGPTSDISPFSTFQSCG